MKPPLVYVAASILLCSAGAGLAQEQIRTKRNAGYFIFDVCVHDRSGDIIGPYLADDNGMTLYVFDRDAPEKSACTAASASNWLPLGASAGDTKVGEFGIIRRDDGSTHGR
jgi:predicted lipoprotein with Yx(FWY)xxD motif